MKKLMRNAKKLFAMPYQDIIIRICGEIGAITDRIPPGIREARLTEKRLLKLLNAPDIDILHCRLMEHTVFLRSKDLKAATLEHYLPGEITRIGEKAKEAMAGRVCLLDSKPVELGKIDWYRDYKSGLDWAFRYFKDINVADLDLPSDVKFPWEISRLQWLIPVAQMWQLTGEDYYTEYVLSVLKDWMEHNPYAWGVNWTCTMEPAMRVFTWCWFYWMLGESQPWKDRDFRYRFLRGLYLHLAFVRRYLEISDVNGNHLVAEAAALVIGGVFFGAGKPRKWQQVGWRLLTREIQLQVYNDGVDFEGSVPYHRLVAELFHIAAVAIYIDGGKVPEYYRKRLLRMADYTEAYTRPDGLAPTIGDNDDARTLPLGGQAIGDHRYLPSLIRKHWAPDKLSDRWLENASECLWWWGQAPDSTTPAKPPASKAFADGGSYIMRTELDYIFFECGPLGLSNRGGHGHNDILSFEAVLNGCHLITDPGCLVYTGDYLIRNYYRSTKVHNTPQVAGAEINRFISSKTLWFLHGDSKPELRSWEDNSKYSSVVAAHDGYMRLTPPVRVVRTIVLDKTNHSLGWKDELEPDASVVVRVPLQLAQGVRIELFKHECLKLRIDGNVFLLRWFASEDWALNVEDAKIAPQYGMALDAKCLIWKRNAKDSGGLKVTIQPISVSEENIYSFIFDKLL